jgi:hypothetical protein
VEVPKLADDFAATALDRPIVSLEGFAAPALAPASLRCEPPWPSGRPGAPGRRSAPRAGAGEAPACRAPGRSASPARPAAAGASAIGASAPCGPALTSSPLRWLPLVLVACAASGVGFGGFLALLS